MFREKSEGGVWSICRQAVSGLSCPGAASMLSDRCFYRPPNGEAIGGRRRGMCVVGFCSGRGFPVSVRCWRGPLLHLGGVGGVLDAAAAGPELA